jgi:N-acyl-L-homoserine lactone synthetase
MLFTVSADAASESAVLGAMFEARKHVFVDLLGWDLPVLDERYEIDQFDNGHARYLIIADDERRHLASARLLPTIRPHILDSLFHTLCEEAPPRGEAIFEITRFCLDRHLTAARRRQVRDALITALVEHALRTGISSYTGVAEIGWLQQILAFGWRCRPLGAPQTIGGRMLGALRIDITRDTPALLARAGFGGEHREVTREAA